MHRSWRRCMWERGAKSNFYPTGGSWPWINAEGATHERSLRSKEETLFTVHAYCKARPLPFCWNLEPNGATEYLPYRSLARLHILSQRAHLRVHVLVHGPCYFYMLSVTRFIQSLNYHFTPLTASQTTSGPSHSDPLIIW